MALSLLVLEDDVLHSFFQAIGVGRELLQELSLDVTLLLDDLLLDINLQLIVLFVNVLESLIENLVGVLRTFFEILELPKARLNHIMVLDQLYFFNLHQMALHLVHMTLEVIYLGLYSKLHLLRIHATLVLLSQ